MTFPVSKAYAILSLYPEGYFFAIVNGRRMLLKGSVMKGFILANDTLTEFRRLG